jgi:hypothetical protein
MSDSFKDFWAWVGAGTAIAGGLLMAGLVLKDQSGAVNILNAGGTQATNLIGALAKVGG